MALRSRIGRAELEILQYIQDHHPLTVRQVADHVAATKGHGRTTVLNVMTRLVKKGYLSRRKEQGVFHYAPRVAKGTLLRNLVRDFVDKALGGSTSPFVAYLAEDANLSPQEIQQLRQLVKELESRPRNAEKGAP